MGLGQRSSLALLAKLLLNSCLQIKYVCSLKSIDSVVPFSSRGLEEDRARWFYQQLILALDYCHKVRVGLCPDLVIS